MADVDGVVLTKQFIDSLSDSPALLKAIYDDVAGEYTLKVQATGVTFDGTLDPTNLALEAGNLQKIAKTSTPTLGTTQKLAVGVAAAATANTIGATRVLLISTTNCHILLSDAGTGAAITDFYLPANTYLALVCASTNKVSAIRDTADGNLYVTDFS